MDVYVEQTDESRPHASAQLVLQRLIDRGAVIIAVAPAWLSDTGVSTTRVTSYRVFYTEKR